MFRPFPSAPLHLYICWLSPIQTRVTPYDPTILGCPPQFVPHWWCTGVWFSNCDPQLPSFGGHGCLTFCPPGRHWDESMCSGLCVLARHVGQHCQPPSAVRTVRCHSTLPAPFTCLPSTDTRIPLPTCRGWLLSLSRSTLSGVRWPI